MSFSIQRAAVVGSGVMGSALAAHLANAGIPTLLLDIVPPAGAGVKGEPTARAYRDAFSRSGLERAVSGKPAAFFSRDRARRVTIGNLEDDLALLRECDWILEAVVERLDIKQQLFEKIAPFVHERAIVTSNTAGLSITDMAAALPAVAAPALPRHALLQPAALPAPARADPAPRKPIPAVLAFMREFGDAALGKGVVVARDTPNFIANRIGTFTVMSAVRDAQRRVHHRGSRYAHRSA